MLRRAAAAAAREGEAEGEVEVEGWGSLREPAGQRLTRGLFVIPEYNNLTTLGRSMHLRGSRSLGNYDPCNFFWQLR